MALDTRGFWLPTVPEIRSAFVGGQFRHPDGSAVQQGQQDGQLRQGQIGAGLGVLRDFDASAHHVEQLGEDLLQVSCKVRDLRLRRRHSSIV